MKIIHPAIMEECARMDRWMDRWMEGQADRLTDQTLSYMLRFCLHLVAKSTFADLFHKNGFKIIKNLYIIFNLVITCIKAAYIFIIKTSEKLNFVIRYMCHA